MKIMAGLDKISPAKLAMAGTKMGYLEQEPQLNAALNVRGTSKAGVSKNNWSRASEVSMTGRRLF
jgi:hypothetical protein